ncbi:MAG: ATP synthase F1 subunit epsilon [Zymomonas mobilis subsp. pomaceae]|uniref:ATPase, F1 complex, delta/epsilon subunit-like protein n=1 Tax=Zymomonas mobilis subsp. pomaceae (strain ATCC 29192 / DSM 22645 / JCM 10191 / CCUG 17912 / NBRC 13757 / NCIMB 11200 / NRRL B-4491 / Barker I) TaxID=579138 RepID=F8ESQ4_ZYMMT|nr:ATP synthase F1 subunit epsilon [Zymomonas mobilis]AEI37829.1 ATPase, F1 complex, delta/epsilon subunit-like protein [Zymomonas mobilis subsp. pomaceae ATCC 29192]MDX5949196.1 ATP synthase F1 subunit epsilon [Zymomonas mobilis subsp. pomaceae]GEB89576.1 hypothetical protein ZMO02_12130 [Zymomonas mobilis subsp. pomaceae]
MAELHYELVTPARLARSGDAFMVVVPGTEGDLGVMAGHMPTMTAIRDGEVAIYSSEHQVETKFHISGGFAEINEKGLIILAEEVKEES